MRISDLQDSLCFEAIAVNVWMWGVDISSSYKRELLQKNVCGPLYCHIPSDRQSSGSSYSVWLSLSWPTDEWEPGSRPLNEAFFKTFFLEPNLVKKWSKYLKQLWNLIKSRCRFQSCSFLPIGAKVELNAPCIHAHAHTHTHRHPPSKPNSEKNMFLCFPSCLQYVLLCL